MNLFFGSTIKFPFRVDDRGTFMTTDDPATIVDQAIEDLIMTRKGERRMLPDYGISDFCFEVADATFTPRIAHELETQIKRYVPMVESVKVRGGIDERGEPSIIVERELRGQMTAPGNLIFPIWRLRRQ